MSLPPGSRAGERDEAGERTRAERDRYSSLSDRGASASERATSYQADLPGVYLRAAGFVELEREISRARLLMQPLTLALVDVDGLEAIKDSRGDAAGDRVLLEVANILNESLRPYDLIIRYGDDEFVCTLPGLASADATEQLAKVNDALAEAPEHGSVTIGLAELQPDDSREDLIARAEAALHGGRKR